MLDNLKILQVEETADFGKFVVEPLNPGFGHTLGNSLRRILMTALPGTAVTQVKISGVRHQFSTIAGMTEDVIELILNIKKIRLKGILEKPVKLNLEVKGPKVVTAADITPAAGVEIANPKLVLAHLAENKSKLDIEMIAESGTGYQLAEERKTGEIGVIAVDALFTPVNRVNYRVDLTRVGRLTNFDKLTLEIYTDGTIKPSESLKVAARILTDSFRIFYEPVKPQIAAKAEVSSQLPQTLTKMTLEELDLPLRITNAFKLGGVVTVEDFVAKPDGELTSLKNVGPKAVVEVKKVVDAFAKKLSKDATK